MADFDYDRAIELIRNRHSADFPKTALVLGSGLGRFGDSMAVEAVLPYDEIAGFPVSTVPGHSGRLLIGKVEETPLVAMQGRMHLYEGYPAAELAIAIRTLKLLGVQTLILTNAAGSLRPEMEPGSLMLISDHINFSGHNPLIGPNDERFGTRFFDMSHAYDPSLRTAFKRIAAAEDIGLEEGVYVQVAGPNFETPAEIAMFARWGADAVGMSTVPECLVARHAGLRVAGLSVITNLAAGIAEHTLSHDETIGEAEKAFDKTQRLLTRFFREQRTD